MAAIVAHEPFVGAVIGQPGTAPGTLRRFAAVHTHQRAGVAPAVQKQHHLLSVGGRLADSVLQRIAQAQVIAQLYLLLHVHDPDLRERSAAPAVGERIQPVDAGPGTVHGLHRRGCRAHEHHRFFFKPPPQSHLFSGIAGRIVGFIGVLLLLVQDQQTQLGTWGKHRGAGTYHHPGLAGANCLPLVIALRRRQRTVEHCHPVTKPGGHHPQKLGSQGDLRHQQHRLTALFQALLDQPDIHRGLAGAGNTIKERRTRCLLHHLLPQALKGLLLIFVQP